MKRLSFLSPVLALVLSSLFIVTPHAGAQQAVTSSLPGITVSGTGSASAPAEAALVVIMLGSDPYMFAGSGAMDQPPAPPSAPIVTAEDIAAPVVDALVTAGLSPDAITIISNPYAGGYGPYGGPQTVSIQFELEDPTIEGITDLLDPAITAAMGARLFINMTSVVYSIEDCAPILQEAREVAITDARKNAELQAEALGVSLGDVVASRDNPYGLYGSPYYGVAHVNSCMADGADPNLISLYGGPAFDPMLPAEVTVQASIDLTFEIETGNIATPSS